MIALSIWCCTFHCNHRHPAQLSHLLCAYHIQWPELYSQFHHLHDSQSVATREIFVRTQVLMPIFCAVFRYRLLIFG